jgi:hypothetical protein
MATRTQQGAPPVMTTRNAAATQAYAPNAGYPDPYAGYAYANAAPMAVEDPAVVAARSTHRRGSVLYALAWVVIGLSVVLLAMSLGLLISGLLGGSAAPSWVDYLLFGSLAMLGAGMAIRGAGFALMLRADFLVRSRMVPDVPYQ